MNKLEETIRKLEDNIDEIERIKNYINLNIVHRYYQNIKYPHVEFPDEFNDNQKKELDKLINIYHLTADKMNEIYQKRTEQLEKEREEIENEIKELNKQIKDEKKKMEDNLLKEGCKTLHELYYQIPNYDQRLIFDKILKDTEYAKIYLSRYDPNNTNKNPDLLGTISVLGTFNIKKQERESYDIKIYRQSEKGTFWCSCPDHKFNSSKKGTVCKHICFVVCKILRYLNRGFFDTKKLPDSEIDKLINKLTTNIGEIDKSLIKQITKVTLDTFKNFVKELDPDDSCPICFDNYETKDKVACPSCHNYIHSECIEVILENRDNCLWCLDSVWSKYKTIKKNNII